MSLSRSGLYVREAAYLEITEMFDEPFHSCDVAHLRRTLARHHEQVTDGNRRVEFTRDGSNEICVIMTKAELQALERALEIFAETEEYKAMCRNLSRLAQECGARGPADDVIGAEAP